MPGVDASLPRGRAVLSAASVHVHFDGACRPPRGGGVATYGFTLEGAGLRHEECGLAAPPWSARATNNVAEYVAAIRSLEWLRGARYSGPVRLAGDSQLVIRQMLGEYRVRAPHLHDYHERLRTLGREFERVEFRWVPREQNTRADELSKEALDAAWPAALQQRPAATVEPEPEEKDDGPSGTDADGGAR